MVKVVPTLIVGVIALWIAWNQGATAKAKLNFDLFNRRLEIFQEVWGAASHVSLTGQPCYAQPGLTNRLPEVKFLFGEEVSELVNDLVEKINRVAIIRKSTAQNNSVVPPERIQEQLELEAWIFNAAQRDVRDKFEPYLNFSKWR